VCGMRSREDTRRRVMDPRRLAIRSARNADCIRSAERRLHQSKAADLLRRMLRGELAVTARGRLRVTTHRRAPRHLRNDVPSGENFMGKLIRKLTKAGHSKSRKAIANAESAAMAAVGRKTVRAKAKVAKGVARKAVKAGLRAGAIAAAAVVVREIRKPS
jgi:hypothetical protein